MTDGAMGRTRHLADILTALRRWGVEPSTAPGWRQGETRRRTRGRGQSGAGNRDQSRIEGNNCGPDLWSTVPNAGQ